VEIEGAAEGEVGQHEGEALEPVAAAILEEDGHNHHRDKQGPRLKLVHVEVHRDTHRPAENHAEGDDQHGDLRR